MLAPLRPSRARSFDSERLATSRTSAAVFALGLLLLAGLGHAATPALPGVMYGSTGNNDGGQLITIDVATGVGTLITDIAAPGVSAVAIRSDGALFGNVADQLNPAIIEIDAVDGSTTGQVMAITFRGFAFDDADVLYGADNAQQLQIIDPATGGLTLVGGMGVSLNGIAFDRSDGTLYGCSGTDLYTIDVSTGAATLVGPFGFTNVTDLSFDGDGNLFAVAGALWTPNELLSVDETTGTATSIGLVGFISTSGLTFWVDPSTSAPPPVSPGHTMLHANAPNPFNPATTVSFDLARPGPVSIVVFDLAGRRVRSLLERDLPAGTHQVRFDGRQDDGRRMPSGTYLVRLVADGTVVTRPAALVK